MADAIVLEATYTSWSALHRDVTQQIAMGGLLLRMTESDLEQYSPLILRLRPPSGPTAELRGQVLQVIPGQGVAIQFEPDTSETVADLQQMLASHPDESVATADDPTVKKASRRSARLKLASDPVELRRQIEAMTVNDKRQIAISGAREVRLLLIRDRQKAVHPFVLKNPRITMEEIEAFTKMPSVNPDALRMVAGNRDWTRSPAVCRNLVRNPKTPMREALAMLDRLPIGEVRVIAKTGNVRMPIQAAARKKVNA